MARIGPRRMTTRLVNDPGAIAALSARVADRTGLPAEHIEKDFWVTEVLRGVTRRASELGVEAVFKGGTSLSKAHRLIERFSEDVDLLVILPADTTGAKERLLKSLVAAAAEATSIEAASVGTATTKGVKRGARFHYRASDGSPTGGLSNGVFLEIGSRGGAMPTAVMPIRSLLAEHAPAEIAGSVEADSFDARVLRPSRTLVEKLVLLHTASLDNNPAALVRGARHYYDIHQLLGQAEVANEIRDVGIAILARDVFTYSTAAALAAEPRPLAGFARSPAFTDGPHLDAVRADYENRVLGVLLWPRATRPSFDACLDKLSEAELIL
jgi:urease gamma subunit